MKTGIFITARLGSTRLKKKHLLEVNGKAIIVYLIKRLTAEFKREIGDAHVEVVITTSDEVENREFEALERFGVRVFYGSPNNIPLRHLQAAKALGFDSIISIDGDDILCSVTGARRVYESLNSGAEYVKTTNLPFGMNSTGYTTNFLEESLVSYSKDFLETGWGRIFDTEKIVNIDMGLHQNNDRLRFTLDYEMDFDFFKVLIEALGEGVIEISDRDVVELVISRKMFRLNEAINIEYWHNFNKNVTKELSQNE
ncbi:hypothetical protein [Desulfosporosinus sp. Sb-LF]|uniref:cytidylyltransferase domain-containing protein n=1 Tax=Desulfosporosinus sp. Sb-LF TaxID=2560027 RepID=UPI00107F66F4|nr:hypothetical protein [Desulfosporosinus sp. Sb-LF]TGE33015.1 hypothetical protein E4K68_09230 [Desulfosporosinus sp. Sb-LF]